MRNWTVPSCTVGAILAWAAVAGAAPRAATIPKSWQLDFEFHDPQRLVLTLPGDQHGTTYWYLLYRVTNRTGRDVAFYPSVKLVTDTLDVVVAGDEVNPRIYDVIAARHKIEFPFLAPPADVTGALLQGEENARSSAAVFRTFDPQADSFTVHVSGLSGEIKRIPNPAFDPSEGETESNPRAFILRRTLAVRYDLPGDAGTSTRGIPLRRSREWLMR